MRKRIFALLFSLFFCLSGCSLNFKDPEDLIRPPKPGGELAGVQEALQAKVEKNSIILKNPKSGEYRSAYTRFDVDGDGADEAIVFYKQNTDTGKLHMNILDKDGGKWVSIADFDDIGTDIIEVQFCDLNGSGTPEMIVKCDSIESKQYHVTVYQCTAGAVNRLLSRPYTEMTLVDMIGSGYPQLLLLHLNTTRHISRAYLMKLEPDATEMEYIGETELDGTVTDYTPLKMDRTGTVYVDGYFGPDIMVTELLQWEGGKLTAPLMNKKEGYTSQNTMRGVIITSQDINNDGIIEIPVNDVMAGQNSYTQDTIWLTTWYRYTPGTQETLQDFTPVLTGAINFADSYMFVYPPEWVADVTVVADNEQRLWTFYRWDAKNQILGAKLLSIISTTKTQWEKEPIEGYTLLKEKGTTVYAVRLFDEPSERALTFEQMEKNLIIIN